MYIHLQMVQTMFFPQWLRPLLHGCVFTFLRCGYHPQGGGYNRRKVRYGPTLRKFFPWSPVEAADLSALDVLMQLGRPPPSAQVGSQEVSVGQRVSSLRKDRGGVAQNGTTRCCSRDNLNHQLVIWDTEEKEPPPRPGSA